VYVEGHSALYQQSEASEPPVYCVAGSAQLNSGIQLTVTRLRKGQPWLTVIRVPVVWQGSGESAIGGLITIKAGPPLKVHVNCTLLAGGWDCFLNCALNVY
jgi:hypothetical protein